MCCLPGLLGPLGIAMVACLGKEARNSSGHEHIAGLLCGTTTKNKWRASSFLAKHVAFRGVGDIGGFREDEALVSIWIDMESAFLGYFDL